MEELKAALAPAVAPFLGAAGLEELGPANLIDGWDALGKDDQARLSQELADAVDPQMLGRLVVNARNPVVPPRTLTELLAANLGQDEADVQRIVESLPSTAWQPPATVAIGESQNLLEPTADELRDLLETTVIMVAAGGGGARFKRSLPPAFREQLERRGRLEKPTVMLGPSGLSPTVRTLLEVAELAWRVGARNVQVIVVDAPDSADSVHRDVQEGTAGVDPQAVKIRMTEQETWPSFDPQSGKILTTQDDQGNVTLLRNPDGTMGTFLAAYRKAKEEGVAEGKDWLVLYGDDPRLNAAGFIARALHQRRMNGLDTAVVTTPKLTPTVPVGGTRADLLLPDGRRLPLIIEKAERTPNPARGIAGLPGLNEVEAAETAKGTDPFGFNSGVLLLSAYGAKLVSETPRLIRYADRDRDDVPGGKRRNLETFLTHALTVVGAAGMKFGDLQVDSRQYQAVKEYALAARAAEEMDRRSRETLAKLPGGSGVSILSESCLDILPGFTGFRGEGRLNLSGAAGYVLSRDGLYVVPMAERQDVSWKEPDPADPSKEITRTVSHPIFADPEQAQLLLVANAEGTLLLDREYSFSGAGLEEGVERRRFLGEEIEQAAGFLGALPRAQEEPGILLLSPDSLAGSPGVPALAPLLVAVKRQRPAAEWEAIRERVLAYTADAAVVEWLEAEGYRIASTFEQVEQGLPPVPGALTLYASVDEGLLRRQVQATSTVILTPETFLDGLSGLLKLLGYVPPAETQELKPLANILYRAAQA